MANSNQLTGEDTSWIVVMSRTEARLFSRTKRHGPLVLEAEREHLEGRAHQRDLTTDLGGRTFDRHGPGRHSVDAEYDPRASGIEEFVRRVAADVERGRVRGEFEHLILIAPPKVLGLLRSSLTADARALVIAEASKQIVDADLDTIARTVDEALD